MSRNQFGVGVVLRIVWGWCGSWATPETETTQKTDKKQSFKKV